MIRRLGKKKKLHEVDLSSDIRYRGPFSYRSFQIFGWICIVLSQVALWMGIIGHLYRRIDPIIEIKLIDPQMFLSAVSYLSIPFLLLSNFALILNCRDSYKGQLLRYGIASAAVIILSLCLYYRYFVHAIAVITQNSPGEASRFLEDLFPYGFRAFNFFVDLFLCALFLFFLNYQPGKLFTGKKVIIFRLFAVFPAAYEVILIILKALSVKGALHMPAAVYPFLPVKPPMMFLVFLVLALYLKNRESRFCRNGRTHEEYSAFLQTNRNALHFSIFTAVLMAATGLADLLIFRLFIGMDFRTLFTARADIFDIVVGRAFAIGFGYGATMLVMAPIILLFSYTRTHRNQMIDLIIPLGGIAIILVIYLEGLHYSFDLWYPRVSELIEEGKSLLTLFI
jgi:hypothetical protein